MSLAKRQEALEHCAAAEKALATGFFKRKPDYDTAATEYELAGMSRS
jgi:hypothetical protein